MADFPGPFIAWIDYGYDGWKPTNCASLDEAVKLEAYGATKIITRPVLWRAEERKPTLDEYVAASFPSSTP